MNIPAIYRARRSASRPKLPKLEQLRSDTRAAETDRAGGLVRRVVEAGFSAVVAVHELPIGISLPSAP